MIKNKLLPILALLMLPVVCLADNSEQQNPVLATVNGIAITQQEVAHFISKQAQPIPQERALQEMINVELLVQDARNQNIMQDQTLALEIKRNTSALIASHYLQKILQQLQITEQEIKSRYQQQYLQGDKAFEYNANHILVKTEDEAKTIIQQLDQGAEFTELAKSLSIGPSGKDGGALGWFKATDMVAPFSEATTKLSSGKHSSQPVQTQFGWHIILLNEVRAIEPPEFDSVRQQLQTAIAAETISNKIKNLNDKADIKLNP